VCLAHAVSLPCAARDSDFGAAQLANCTFATAPRSPMSGGGAAGRRAGFAGVDAVAGARHGHVLGAAPRRVVRIHVAHLWRPASVVACPRQQAHRHRVGR